MLEGVKFFICIVRDPPLCVSPDINKMLELWLNKLPSPQANKMLELWLSQNLMVIGAVIIGSCCVSVLLLQLDDGNLADPGLVGLGITQALNLIWPLETTAKNLTMIEAQLSAVERLWEYGTELELEDEKFPGFVRVTNAERQWAAAPLKAVKPGRPKAETPGREVELADVVVCANSGGAGAGPAGAERPPVPSGGPRDVPAVDSDRARELLQSRRTLTWSEMAQRMPALVGPPPEIRDPQYIQVGDIRGPGARLVRVVCMEDVCVLHVRMSISTTLWFFCPHRGFVVPSSAGTGCLSQTLLCC